MEGLKVGVISQSATNWPFYVAEAKGFFKEEGLRVVIAVTGDSVKQIQGLADGPYDITHQAADHFIRAIEGGHDLFVFMTIARPSFAFLTDPRITSVKDLRGKTVALDHPTTGYWLLFQKLFAQHGLPPDDYQTLPYMGGAQGRLQALKDGRAQGTFLNPPLSGQAIAQGFRPLTTLGEHFPDLPGTSGGARRNWAKERRSVLVRYIRAYMKAVDWLLDPSHREGAIGVYRDRVGIEENLVRETYDSFVKESLVPKVALSLPGLKSLIEVMGERGQLTAPLPAPQKYADPSYQVEAFSGAAS